MTDNPENPPELLEIEAPTVRLTFPDGDGEGYDVEVELTAEQALDLGAGKPITYIADDEDATLLADDEGNVTLRESAAPDERRGDKRGRS